MHHRQQIIDRDELVKQGLLRCDDLGDLRIYTYTNECAYKKKWDEVTSNSRGHIYNRKTGERVACAFPKFFNLNERRDTQERNLPWSEGFRIFRKEDGWLGILYRLDGKYRVATRGSFQSVGAKWATKHLQQYNLTDLPDEVTLLFEIICPNTSIVVDYGLREDLILLTAYNRHTGEEYDWDQVNYWSKQFGFTLVQSNSQNWLGYCRGQLKTTPGDQLEGFVIRFNDGFRIKMKSEDYFRRAKLMFYLTPLAIWDAMHNGHLHQSYLDMVDEKHKETVRKIATELERSYNSMRESIDVDFAVIFRGEVDRTTKRKAFSARVNRVRHRRIMFACLDGKEDMIDKYIMEQIRPHNNQVTNA